MESLESCGISGILWNVTYNILRRIIEFAVVVAVASRPGDYRGYNYYGCSCSCSSASQDGQSEGQSSPKSSTFNDIELLTFMNEKLLSYVVNCLQAAGFDVPEVIRYGHFSRTW